MSKNVLPNGLIAIVIFAMTVACSCTSFGQEFDQYGLPLNRGTQATQAEKPKLFDFSRPVEREPMKNPFSGLFAKKTETDSQPFRPFQNVEMPKLNMPKFQLPKWEGPLFARPSWLPERDPSEPTFLERMNASGKNLVDRSTNWAKGVAGGLREKRTSSWDAIRETTERIQNQKPALLTPPTRSADGRDSGIIKY